MESEKIVNVIGAGLAGVEAAYQLAKNNIKSYVFESLRPTPELSFAVRHLHCFGGIMITASHNPKEYNGYKLYDDKGCQLIPCLASQVIDKVNAIEDELAIDAMKLLKDQGVKARWYVLGKGELRDKLQQKIDSLGLKEDFLLLGAVENPYPYYKQCDLYVHATRFEGKSIAIQEAQILGCTILVSNCSGNREQVENGTDGVLCQLSSEEISRNIAELLGNEEKCREYGKKATVRISDEQGDILKLFEIA